MAAVTISNDFEALENKVCHCIHVSPSVHHEVMELWETFRGLKQNLVCTKTQRPHGDWARPVFECLLGRYRPAVACHRSRGSGCSRPASHSLWHKPFWKRSPLAPSQSLQADDPLTAEQLHQRNYHNVEKVLGPTKDFPTWLSGKGTENPQGIWLWRAVEFDYGFSTGLGTRHLEDTDKTLCAPRPRW